MKSKQIERYNLNGNEVLRSKTKESDPVTDYNNLARRYHNAEKNAVTLWHLGYDHLIRYLDPVENKSVLDYGCGSGAFSRFLSEKKAIVTGVDISENMIDVAKNTKPDGISYFQINSGNLDFLPENTFDYVVSNFVFCTISNRHEIFNVLKSINRVLKANGSLVIMNTNWDKSNGQEFVSFKLQYSRSLLPGSPVTAVIKTDPPIILKDYYWSKANYSDLLTESGFEIRDISEPLARGKQIKWLAEKSYPPYYLINSKKFFQSAQPSV